MKLRSGLTWPSGAVGGGDEGEEETTEILRQAQDDRVGKAKDRPALHRRAARAEGKPDGQTAIVNRGYNEPIRLPQNVQPRDSACLRCQSFGFDGFGPGHLTEQHDSGGVAGGEVFLPHTDPEAVGRVALEHRVAPALVPTAESDGAKNAFVAVGKPFGLDSEGNLRSCSG